MSEPDKTIADWSRDPRYFVNIGTPNKSLGCMEFYGANLAKLRKWARVK